MATANPKSPKPQTADAGATMPAEIARCLLSIDTQADPDLLAAKEWWDHKDEDGAWTALRKILKTVKQAQKLASHCPQSDWLRAVTPVLQKVHHILTKAKSSDHSGPNLAITITHALRTIHDKYSDRLIDLGTTFEAERLPGPSRKKPGRKMCTDPEADARIGEAWQMGTYRTFADLANALGTSERDVRLACDRYRKRHKTD
jgi:hypothetical protein